MELHRVDPVDVIECLGGSSASARVYPPPLRIVTALVLGVFVVVSVATTVYSLGAYCLTSGNGPIALLGF